MSDKKKFSEMSMHEFDAVMSKAWGNLASTQNVATNGMRYLGADNETVDDGSAAHEPEPPAEVQALLDNWPAHAMAERIVKDAAHIAELEAENVSLKAAVAQLADQLVAPVAAPREVSAFPANALKHSV